MNMEKIFLRILDMSITGAYVILFIMLARLLLRRFPKIFSYALWSAALFRLACPFSLKGAFSLVPSKAQSVPKDIIRAAVIPHGGDAGLNGTGANVSIAVDAAAGTEPMQIWISAGTAVWVGGALLLLCFSVISMLRLCKRLKHSKHVRDNIYEMEGMKTPFVFGIVNPRIYIPANLTENEKSYIIKHEETHIKRFDHIIKPVAFLILCLHWFNPFVWAAFYLMSEDMELSCDESVIRKMGSGIKKDYSSSLLSFSAGRTIGPCPLAFGESNPKGRIKNILNYRKPAFWIVVLALAVVSAILIGLVTNLDVKHKTVDDYAMEYLDSEVEMYENYFKVEDSKIINLEKMQSFDQLTGYRIELWKIEYRIKPGNIDEVAMAGGMNQIDGWITEDGSMGKPILVFSYEKGSPELLGAIRSGEMGVTVSGYETALREFLERKGLLPGESYEGNHAVANFTMSTGETARLLLSQPARQGETGIWCVERWMDGNGSVYYSDPQASSSTVYYYDELQKEADNGHRTGLLDPDQVALEYIVEVLGQTTDLDETEIKNPATIQDFMAVPESRFLGFVSDFDTERSYFHLDRVEWLTYDDEERIRELGLSKDDDMPGGFYIYNPESWPQTFEVDENTEYTILDWNRKYGDEQTYTTTDASEFADHINSYEGGFAPPFWIVKKGRYVESITEQYVP